MAERRPSDAALERALAGLGGAIDYPPTPDLGGTVRARVAAGRPRPSFWVLAHPWPRLAGALALTVLVAVVAVLALSSDAREAVADRLGLRGVSFAPVEDRSTATATATTTPAGESGPFGGVRVSLDAARRSVTFPVRVPSLPGLAEPDEVYAGSSPPGGAVTLLYRPRPGLPPTGDAAVGMLITQFRGAYEPFIRKGLTPGTRLEEVRIGGARGYWLEGGPHQVVYQDANGAVREDRARLAGNTLLWERDGVTYRLESALGRDEAIRIGESLR